MSCVFKNKSRDRDYLALSKSLYRQDVIMLMISYGFRLYLMFGKYFLSVDFKKFLSRLKIWQLEKPLKKHLFGKLKLD